MYFKKKLKGKNIKVNIDVIPYDFIRKAKLGKKEFILEGFGEQGYPNGDLIINCKYILMEYKFYRKLI
jgi:hypothetical protein